MRGQRRSGQHIDIALLDSAVASFTKRGQTYLSAGEVPRRNGSAIPGNQQAGLYSCSDGEIVLSAGADRQFQNLARIIGHDDWVGDPRFSSRALARPEWRVINTGINAALSADTRAHWLELFQASGFMWAPINNVAEEFEHPQVKHCKVVIEVEHPRPGQTPMMANPIHMSGALRPPPIISPDVGQHTDELLRGILGLSTDDIADLRSKNAI